MTRRRRDTESSQLTTIYWRDIPAQVTASHGRVKEKAILHHRFQDAIDRAAAVAGLTAAHDYVNEWRRVTQPVSGDLRAAADEEAARLQESYPPSRLHALVKQGGLEDPATVPTDDHPTDDQPTDDRPTDDQPTDDQPTDDQPTDDQPTDDQPTDDQQEATP